MVTLEDVNKPVIYINLSIVGYLVYSTSQYIRYPELDTLYVINAVCYTGEQTYMDQVYCQIRANIAIYRKLTMRCPYIRITNQ